jgi:hypothetical protein
MLDGIFVSEVVLCSFQGVSVSEQCFQELYMSERVTVLIYALPM